LDPKELTTPDGKTAKAHIAQIKTIAEYLSYADRCTLVGIVEHSQSGSAIVMGSNLASLDILNEIDESVRVLQTLRGQIVGIDPEFGLTAKDNETIKSISTTISLMIKNSQLLAKTSRISSLQKGLVSYADTLEGRKKTDFLDAIKKHINQDFEGEL
jgi:hypothetical protein